MRNAIPYAEIGELAVAFGEIELAMFSAIEAWRAFVQDPVSQDWMNARKGRTVGTNQRELQPLIDEARAADELADEVLGHEDYAWAREVAVEVEGVNRERNSIIHRAWTLADGDRPPLSARTSKAIEFRGQAWEVLTSEAIEAVTQRARDAAAALWALADLAGEIRTTPRTS